MQVYRVTYRRDEWVSVKVGFDDSINLEQLEEQSAVEHLAVCDELRKFESYEHDEVSHASVDVESVGEGTPVVIIGKDADGDYCIKSI